MKIDSNKKVLIIPDVHQNIGFVERCLNECPDFQHIVFLGDYFDTFYPPEYPYGTVKDTAIYLSDLHQKYGDKITFLLGNHDLAYLATYRPKKHPIKNFYYNCSGYSRSKAFEFNSYALPEWVDSWQLSTQVGEYWLVHGGWHHSHMLPHQSPEKSIQYWVDKWNQEKQNFATSPFHWIWDASKSRGGFSQYSSPIWMDWSELAPIEGINQIVGHTNSLKTVIRKKMGDSMNFCLDCDQQMFATLHNNHLDIQTLKR